MTRPIVERLDVPVLRVVREPRPLYTATAPLSTARAVFDAFRPHFLALDREEFAVALLDSKHRPLGLHVVSLGTLTASLVHPREVFKVALLANAASLILLHNHPSGDPKPSTEDLAITNRLRQAGTLLGVEVLDHVIFGDETYASLTELGV